MSVCRFFLFFFFLLLLLLLLLARPWKKKFEFQNTETSSSSFENRVADRGELALQIATRQIVSLSLEPTRLPEIEETHHVVMNGKRGKREREREVWQKVEARASRLLAFHRSKFFPRKGGRMSHGIPIN